MYGEWRVQESLEHIRTEVAEHVSENVHHDDAGCSEFYAQTFLQTDQQGHRHREDRQQEFVLEACGTTSQSHDSVKDGKDVDYPRSLYIMKSSHVIEIASEVRNFDLIIQFLDFVRRKKRAFHQKLRAIRRWGYTRLIYNDYFSKLL